MKTISTLRDSRIAVAVILVIICFIGGCSKDCPTCPTDKPVEHYKGWLYYVEASTFYAYDIYKVDMETDSIVDSLRSPVEEKGGVALLASEDGRYLGILWTGMYESAGKKTILYDAQSMTVIRELPVAVTPFFDAADHLIVGITGTDTGNFVTVLTLPGCEVISVSKIGNFIPEQISPAQNLLYGPVWNTGWTHEYPDGFYSYNYITKEMRRIPISLQENDTVGVFISCLNDDGTKIFFHGLASWLPVWGFVGCADLASGRIQWWRSMVSHYGDVTLSPDEKELYVTDPGYPDYLNPGTVYILDAQTGQHLEGISLYGYNPIPAAATGVYDLAFSPTGEKVYVCGTPYGNGFGGSLFTIDTRTREINKIFRPDWQSMPNSPRIVPKR